MSRWHEELRPYSKGTLRMTSTVSAASPRHWAWRRRTISGGLKATDGLERSEGLLTCASGMTGSAILPLSQKAPPDVAPAALGWD